MSKYIKLFVLWSSSLFVTQAIAENIVYEAVQVTVVSIDDKSGLMTLRLKLPECVGEGCILEGYEVSPSTEVMMQQVAGEIDVLPSRYLHWNEAFIADVFTTSGETAIRVLRRKL